MHPTTKADLFTDKNENFVKKSNLKKFLTKNAFFVQILFFIFLLCKKRLNL